MYKETVFSVSIYIKLWYYIWSYLSAIERCIEVMVLGSNVRWVELVLVACMPFCQIHMHVHAMHFNVCLLVLIALYPPRIANVACSTGVVEMHYKFDESANADFSTSNQKKNYFFYGGCRDESGREIYRVMIKTTTTTTIKNNKL